MKLGLLAFLAVVTPMASFARDTYIPTVNRPLSMVIHRDHLLNSGVNLARGLVPQNSILKYRFADKITDTISDPRIPESVECIGENTQSIFAGGKDGLGVFDKKEGHWSKWFEESVHALVAGEDRLWLGTANGVMEVDLASRRVKRYTRKNGLNHDRVYSLAKSRGYLFAGTYKQGAGDNKADMLGTGLNRIDLSTGALVDIPVPGETKQDIVLDMYSVAGDADGLRLVVGCLTASLFDYSFKTGKMVKKNISRHHLESALTKKGWVEDSAFAGAFLDYFLQIGLNNWPSFGNPAPIPSDVVHRLVASKDFVAVEGLLGDSNYQIRALTCWALRQVNTPRINAYLIKAIGDPDPTVVRAAASILGDRKVRDAVPVLRNAMKSENEEKKLTVLQALISIEPGIAKEIVQGGHAPDTDRLITIVRIGNHQGIIKSIAGDTRESAETRRRASAVLAKAGN